MQDHLVSQLDRNSWSVSLGGDGPVKEGIKTINLEGCSLQDIMLQQEFKFSNYSVEKAELVLKETDSPFIALHPTIKKEVGSPCSTIGYAQSLLGDFLPPPPELAV